MKKKHHKRRARSDNDDGLLHAEGATSGFGF